MAAGKDSSDLFMSVKLDDNRRLCKVLVSSQTTGEDVIELLKPDDENVYYLVEVWKGCERPIAQEEKLKNVLLQWGSDLDDVLFMLKRKQSSSRQKHTKPSHKLAVPSQLQEKQQKVKTLENEVQQKEKHLRNVRNKETSKNSLKTRYVKLLETRVIEQEEKLISLQSIEDTLYKTRLENENLVLELNRLRSLFALKHQQLSEATAQVELLSRKLAKSSQENDALKSESNVQNPRKQFLNNTQHLSKPQLLQMQTSHGSRPSMQKHNGHLEQDILFLNHGILKEHGDLLSRPNDEENDGTETSGDSGHVSNDSPSYQNKLGQNFQFNDNKPDIDMYYANVERFDIDQDLDSRLNINQEDITLRSLKGLSEVEGWSKLKWTHPVSTDSHALVTPSGNIDPTKELLVNTDGKLEGVGTFFKQHQGNRDSPQSISSLSSLSSESSRNDLQSPSWAQNSRMSYPVNPSSYDIPSDRRILRSISNSSSRSTTPTNERKQSITSDSSSDSRQNSKLKSNVEPLEYKPFTSNENLSSVSHSTTDGALSQCHKKRDNAGRCTSGLFVNERTSLSPSNKGNSENSSERIKSPFFERPTVPNSLIIPNENHSRRSHFSPTVAEPGLNVNHSKTDSPTINSRPMKQVSPSTASNTKRPTEQNIQRKKSPLSADRCIPSLNNTKSQSSTAIVNPKTPTTSDRAFHPNDRSSPKGIDAKSLTSNRRFDPMVLASLRVTDSLGDTSEGSKQPIKGSSVQVHQSSSGGQEILTDKTALKVTAREVKPIQIQTRAEKDSDNIPLEESINKANMSTTETKLRVDKQAQRVRKPPKPVPRKRTKTPPARGSAGQTIPAAASSGEAKIVDSTGKDGSQSKGSKIQIQGMEQASDGLGAKTCDSILRSSRKKGGKKSGKRVSLDPLAVLLHASLEGELELVKNIIHQVEDPSCPNNEGLTALHHAVCNSHGDIVEFLVEYGCDINAADMQGWTSLHCAAANNSIDMCSFLIKHGACVFAVTAIEGKTPSRCCEKESDNFEQCFAYLSDMENNFGISNGGVVYSVYAYEATRKDELTFECGERLTVVRRGDVTEKEWWWARDTRNQFGYIPRNLLGLQPPVAPDV